VRYRGNDIRCRRVGHREYGEGYVQEVVIRARVKSLLGTVAVTNVRTWFLTHGIIWRCWSRRRRIDRRAVVDGVRYPFRTAPLMKCAEQGGRREYVQVLRLLETFREEVAPAIEQLCIWEDLFDA